MGVLVHWSVVREGNLHKRGKPAILSTPGHNQGPGRTGLGLQVTVLSWETVAAIVVQLVDATFTGAFEEVIKTGSGTEKISLLFGCIGTGVPLEKEKRKPTVLPNMGHPLFSNYAFGATCYAAATSTAKQLELLVVFM